MLIFDLETDGLRGELTRVHVLKIKDRATGRRYSFSGPTYADGSPVRHRDGDVDDGVRMLEEADCIGGHNVHDFDVPVLRDLYSYQGKPGQRIRDSLVESRVIWTNIWDIDEAAIKARRRPPEFAKARMRPYSLETWGMRLGLYKGDFKGPWDAFTQDMDVYADQDPEVTEALFDRIDAKQYADQCLRLENDVAAIIALQVDHGFAFDVMAAERLADELQVRKAQLEDQLRSTFKPWWVPERYKGAHVVLTPKTRNAKQGYVAGCPLTKVQQVVFNPASRDHIADQMTKLFGWTPQEFTETGKPKVDETTLDGLPWPEAKLLVDYLTVDKRLGQVREGKEAWLKKVRNGRIHGRVNTNGAVTGRMTHSAPNVAQVPRVGNPYGEECRALFTASPGRVLVGCDAEGLELRMLGHYMARYDGGAYGRTVVNGRKEDGTDVHTVNQRAIGTRTRAGAKTWIYGYLYGAGDYKLGSIFLDDQAPEWRDKFFARHPAGEARDAAIARLGKKGRRGIEEGLPALGQLQALVKEKAKRGFLKSFDGRLIHVRSQHSALNALLQGGGAVVMKQALVNHYRACLARGWVHGREWAYVANVHDEAQMDAVPDLADEVGRLFAEAIAQVTEDFGLKCPLAGAYDKGANWAETH